MPSQVHHGDVDTTKSLNYGTSRRHQPKRNAFGGKNGSSDNIKHDTSIDYKDNQIQPRR